MNTTTTVEPDVTPPDPDDDELAELEPEVVAVRFPFEPLHRVVATLLDMPYCPGIEGCGGCSQKVHAGPAAVARHLGVSTTAPYRWVERGGIPDETADILVMRIGLHPWLIPGWDVVILDAVEQAAACGDCAPIDRDDDWLAQGQLFADWPMAHTA